MGTKLAILCFTGLLFQIASCVKFTKVGSAVRDGGKTYFLIGSNFPSNADNADSYCNKLAKGSHLANVYSKALYDKLVKEAANSEPGVFILTGMTYNKSKRVIHYYDSKQKSGYTKWFGPKPTSSGIVTFGAHGSRNGYYVVGRGTSVLVSLCETT